MRDSLADFHTLGGHGGRDRQIRRRRGRERRDDQVLPAAGACSRGRRSSGGPGDSGSRSGDHRRGDHRLARPASRYGVTAVPTIGLFRDGEVVKQVIGARSKAALPREFGLA